MALAEEQTVANNREPKNRFPRMRTHIRQRWSPARGKRADCEMSALAHVDGRLAEEKTGSRQILPNNAQMD